MFTVGPAFWGGEKDEFASSVIALMDFNDAPGTQIPSPTLGSPIITNGGGASNQVAAAAAYFGSGGWRGTSSPALSLQAPSTLGSLVPSTVEFFFRIQSTATFNRFFGAENIGAGNQFYLYRSGTSLRIARSGGADEATTGTLTIGVWNYVCLQWGAGGTTLTIDLNGTRVHTTSSFSAPGGVSSRVDINGSGGVGGADIQTDFDAFRWTHGVARYSGVAPVPTKAFHGA